MEVSAPKSVLYGDQLPLGLEAKAQKKLFFPTTGDLYSPSSNKTIRIDVNYDGMLDTQQSFLQMKLKNKSGRTASFDIGQPVIKKLTISSGGVVLEEISDYNTLYGGILLPSQAGDQTLSMESMNRTGINFEAAITTPSAAQIDAAGVAGRPGAVQDGDMGTGIGNTSMGNESANIRAAILEAVNNLGRTRLAAADGSGALHDGLTSYNGNFGGGTTRNQLFYSAAAGAAATAADFNGNLADNQEVTINYKLVSGLLDNDKYLPLVLMNAGITIEIELADALECMCEGTNAGDPNYEVNAVRYIGHTIDLQRDFYDRLRMVQQGSGGVLQIVGQSFRAYRGQMPAGTDGIIEINCPARVRSIKSFFFGFKKSGNARNEFNVAALGHAEMKSFQLQIGATRYPPTANEFNPITNKITGYTELMKAFGKVGSTTHRDLLLTQYATQEGQNGGGDPNALIPFCPFGIDLESFRHQIENGIDTSSRALPIQLVVSATPDTSARDVYMYVLYDTIFYINMDGSVSVSS